MTAISLWPRTSSNTCAAFCGGLAMTSDSTRAAEGRPQRRAEATRPGPGRSARTMHVTRAAARGTRPELRTMWHHAARPAETPHGRSPRMTTPNHPDPPAAGSPPRAPAGARARVLRPPLWVWIAAAPIAVFLLAWLALAVLLPPERATRLVREQLSKSLARDVRFEKVTVSLFPPVRLAVKRPELAEPGGFAHGA